MFGPKALMVKQQTFNLWSRVQVPIGLLRILNMKIVMELLIKATMAMSMSIVCYSLYRKWK